MRHEKIKKLVSEYIDGELKDKVEFVKKHIETCDECKTLVELSFSVRETLKYGEIETSPFLVTRIMARVREVRRRENIWRYVIQYARELAVVMLIVLFVILGLSLFFGRVGFIRIDEAMINEVSPSPSVQKVIRSGDKLTKEEVLELTLSNGGKK